MYLAGGDVGDAVDVAGLLIVAFASHGAGTPARADFPHLVDAPAPPSPEPFSAGLARQLLPRGSLGFIGHVDRAWGYSLPDAASGRDVATFHRALRALLSGRPVGHALDCFATRYLDLAARLTSAPGNRLSQLENELPVDPLELAGLITAHHDARGYILHGDPFASLRPASLSDP